jgi:hypothetical protein
MDVHPTKNVSIGIDPYPYENGGNGFAGWILNDFEQPAIDPWRQAMEPFAFSKKTMFFSPSNSHQLIPYLRFKSQKTLV